MLNVAENYDRLAKIAEAQEAGALPDQPEDDDPAERAAWTEASRLRAMLPSEDEAVFRENLKRITAPKSPPAQKDKPA